MGKPMIHAESSATHFGGKPKDYLPIHVFIDSSRDAFPDLRHRALTHHPWFINNIVVRVFGETIQNSNGKDVSVREISEHHVLEDFGGKFMPSAQDYLEEIEFKDWMDNGKEDTHPPSHSKLKRWQGKTSAQEKPTNTKRGGTRIKLPSIPDMKKIFLNREPVPKKRCGPPGTFD